MSRRSNLRILGGSLRGRRLAVGEGVRPTESRVRAALFAIWQERVVGCAFLDLFAGSGAVGLEAISRGAGRAVFVEHAPRVLRLLRRNCGELAPAAVEIVRRRLPGAGREPGGPFDLVFADPPYAFRRYAGLLEIAQPWLADEGEMAIEHSARREVETCAPWELVDRRAYGDSCLSFLRRV